MRDFQEPWLQQVEAIEGSGATHAILFDAFVVNEENVHEPTDTNIKNPGFLSPACPPLLPWRPSNLPQNTIKVEPLYWTETYPV